MKVLVTGASGQVGRALLDSAPAHAELRALQHGALDIGDAAAVNACVAGFAPDVVINAAAYTAVDRAESEEAQAAAVNEAGPRNLARAVQSLPGARLLHVSTDYVFDGRGTEPYAPDAPTHPLGVYGHTKLAGERVVREIIGERAAVLRTAWVYAAEGRNFLLTMLRLMRERGAVRVVSDQRGSPTAAASVARALWALAERPALHGIFHWTDWGVASWYEFACAIAEDAFAAGLLGQRPAVTPITTAEYPTPAGRPHYSVLDMTTTAAALGIEPVPWRTNLRATLQQLRGPVRAAAHG
jgi:dTDP-4-dehydrorhamnose reductase